RVGPTCPVARRAWHFLCSDPKNSSCAQRNPARNHRPRMCCIYGFSHSFFSSRKRWEAPAIIGFSKDRNDLFCFRDVAAAKHPIEKVIVCQQTRIQSHQHFHPEDVQCLRLAVISSALLWCFLQAGQLSLPRFKLLVPRNPTGTWCSV